MRLLKEKDLMALPAHAKYGPSSMARIMACPGSVQLSEKAPPQVESEYAREGTEAHRLGELCLLAGSPTTRHFIQENPAHESEFPPDMRDAVDIYLDCCYGLSEGATKTWIEEKLVFDPELFGTADFMALARNVDGELVLHVVDYKHGAGVAVDPVQNKQLLTYAGLALHMLDSVHDIEHVELTIVQPRAGGPGVRSWETTPGIVRWHMDQVRNAIELAQNPAAPMESGEHCRWCAAKPTCPLLERKARTLIDIEPTDLDPRVLGGMLADATVLEMRIKALREYAHRQLTAGMPVPGWKLVDKRATTRWGDENGAAEFLLFHVEREDIFIEKMVTPAAAKKLIPREALDELLGYTTQSSSGTTLVPEDDKREAVVNLSAVMGAVGSRHK